MKKIMILSLLFGLQLLSYPSFAQAPADTLTANQQNEYTHQLMGGLRFQKAVGFYYSGGVAAEFCSGKLAKKKISLGLNVLSSKLGSALGTNAIGVVEVDASVLHYFRAEKSFRPLVRLNVGYMHANYGAGEFSSIPNQSALLSVEGGVAYQFKKTFQAGITGGYNLITGNGTKGLGTIYPVYIQASFLYVLVRK